VSSGEVKVVDPVKDSRWDRFVMAHPHSTIYHHSTWSGLIRQTYGYVPYSLAIEDGGDDFSAILPLFRVKSWLTGDRLVCLSFAHTCGPLGYSSEDISKLMNHAISYAEAERCDYIEIRSQNNILDTPDLCFVRHDYFSTFILELCSDIDLLWRRLKKERSVEYSVKKARKFGVSVKLADSLSDLKEFYELNLKTRKKHGMPPQPFPFFGNLWKILGQRDMAKILLAEYEGKIIAGITLFVFKDVVTYAYGASAEDYLHLCPIHLLLWEAIQWACESGYRYFDFGRTSPDNQGLWDFKRRWGTTEVPITHYYWPHIAGPASTEERSIKFRILTSMCRRLPTALTQAVAPHLYRHLG
jgi:FemAB-related protein (PEP-CTERM system-associated)